MIGRSVPAGRVDALDAWRALLMAGGLFVHGSTLLDPDPVLGLVQMLSHLFRVGTFYALAGYLSALAVARHGGVAWLARRVRQIGVPLLFGMLFLSPLTWIFIALSPVERPMPLTFEWHHLWFLVGLFAYAPLAVAADAIDRRWSLAPRLCERYGHEKRTARSLLLMFVAATAALTELGQIALTVSLPPDYGAPFANASLILGYAPMFAFGFVMARCERLRRRLVTDCRFMVAILAIAVTANVALEMSGWLTGTSLSMLRELFPCVVAALCPPLVFILALRSTLVIRRVPTAVLRVADASYTIYLLHYPLITAINAQLVRVDWHPQVKYLFTVGIVGVLCYWFHVAVVRHEPLTAFLVNGRLGSDRSPRLDRLIAQWAELGRPERVRVRARSRR